MNPRQAGFAIALAATLTVAGAAWAQDAPAPSAHKGHEWPSFGIDPAKPADALEHILDRTIVVINNTATPLRFSVKLPNQPDWVQYPAPARDALGIFCPTCDEDAAFTFFMQSTKGPIHRQLKANYRYMIVAGASGNWEILTGPALH